MQFPYYLDKVLGHGPIFAVIKPMLLFTALQYFAINRLAAQCWKALGVVTKKITLPPLDAFPPRFLSTNKRALFNILNNLIGLSLTRFRILKKNQISPEIQSARASSGARLKNRF